MNIEHSDLSKGIIEFWFDTSIDGQPVYKTWLDYSNMIWLVRNIENPDKPVLSGNIEEDSDMEIEVERVRKVVTDFIINT